MKTVFMNHPSDDIIELYALRRLAQEVVPAFEEHLLTCAECQDALEVEDNFAKAVAGLKSEPPKQ